MKRLPMIHLIVIGLPAVLGVVVAGFLERGPLTNPIVFLRADAATLLLLLGMVVSAAGGVLFFWRTHLIASYEQRVTDFQAQAADDRRRFLSRLDHELKNPLTAIRAGLANLTPNSSSLISNLPSQGQAITTIEAQALRLSRLTADLRKLAELETRPLETGPVNLGQLLADAVALSREQPRADGRQLNLSVPRAPWPLPLIAGDSDLIFLAVHNLLDNALKFSEPGDTIEVRALEDGNAIAISVADTGPGIPDDELPHVWEELYRGQGARAVPGSGLGLALVRAIVERHGGLVDLRSRAGQGTVVTLRLPVNP